MSAAFALDYSGEPVPCDFPGCTLDAFHDGDHVVAPPKPKFAPERIHTCRACGDRFVIWGENREPALPGELRTCGKQECIVALAKRDAFDVPVLCCCPQRDWPHELKVHSLIRGEWHWPKELRTQWPWSLMASVREEPSTERKQA